MDKSRILRSMLYIPANSWRMVTGGLSGAQDAIILDLEDAVPVGEKETGRIFARDFTPRLKDAGNDVFVRVNSMGTGLTKEDMSYVVIKGLDGIMLPKTETKDDVIRLDELLVEEEKEKGDWTGVFIEADARGSDTTIDYAIFEYGGTGYHMLRIDKHDGYKVQVIFDV